MAIGIIFGNYHSDCFQGIAENRPIAAIPFGGSYRLVDFILSSMVNSGLRTVGIIVSRCYRSLIDHLGCGKEWFLDRKSGGLILLPASDRVLTEYNAKFFLKDLLINIECLEKDNAKHVILSGCNQIHNINFQNCLEFHNDKQADITLIYKEFDPFSAKKPGAISLEICPEGKAQRIFSEESEDFNPELQQKQDKHVSFVDMLIIRRKLLIEIIEEYKFKENMDLIEAVREKLKLLKVYAYPFKGYLGRIDSISGFFEQNMKLFDPGIRNELFMGKDRIYTKIKDNPPTRYGPNALVQNCIIANGCHIEGKIENSVIFQGVQISKGAEIKNSIIMEKCSIGKEVVLENVILDKFVKISDYKVLTGKENHPVVLEKRSVF